ncbi:hypothetical protein J6590_087273 [Homalodisca vitripennis]|nr:hypothetical protein J6590_087273 [Homalodisca vitripennis]
MLKIGLELGQKIERKARWDKACKWKIDKRRRTTDRQTLKKFDDTCIKQADRAAEDMTKEARIKKRKLNLDQEEKK